jgi:hypothetical protein
MAITSIVRDLLANYIVRVTAANTLAEVATADYVTAQIPTTTLLNHGVWEWQVGDMVLVTASDGDNFFVFNGSDFSTFILYSTAGNGAVTLPVVSGDFTMFDGTLGALKDTGISPSDPAKTKAVMAGSAVVVNHIAKFIDTAGTVDDTAGPAINSGNIQAGLSGTAGTLISFPAAAANGSLIMAAVGNAGNFNVTLSSVSTQAQSTVYTIGDIGAATGGIPVATGAISMKKVADAVVAGGAAANTVTDAFCTAASVVLAFYQTQTNPAVIQVIVPGAGSFSVVSDVDPGASTINYVIMK